MPIWLTRRCPDKSEAVRKDIIIERKNDRPIERTRKGVFVYLHDRDGQPQQVSVQTQVKRAAGRPVPTITFPVITRDREGKGHLFDY